MAQAAADATADTVLKYQDIYDKLPQAFRDAASNKDGMCSRALYKWTLVLFNIVFVALGAVVLGIGIFIRFDQEGLIAMLTQMPTDFDVESEDANIDISGVLSSASTILIVVGVLMFVIGFLGCCGAWKEIKWFLIIYAIIIGIIFFLQVAAGIVAVLFRGRLERNFVQYLLASIREGYRDGIHQSGNQFVVSTDATSMAWDLIQIGLRCCGATGYINYRNATNWEREYMIGSLTLEAVVPVSCCRVNNPEAFPNEVQDLEFTDLQSCLGEMPNANFTNTKGCYTAITEWIEANSSIIVGIAIGIGTVEVIGLLFAYWFCQVIEKEQYEELQGENSEENPNKEGEETKEGPEDGEKVDEEEESGSAITRLLRRLKLKK